MKSKILSVLALAVAALGLSSCSNDAWEPALEQTGSVSLASLGIEINADELLVKAPSRDGSEIDLSQFKVMIYDSSDALTHSWTYGSMPEVFTLPVGDYTVEVISHDLQKAEFGRPYYAGSKAFSIQESKITDIGVVTCKFASIRVSVIFTDALRNVMSDDVRVTVVANDEGRLEFLPTETRSGYFAAVDGSTTLVATFKGTVKGYIENIVKPFGDVAAGQHRVIIFDAKDNTTELDPETGSISPGEGINVDVSYVDVDLNSDIDNEEDVIPDTDRPGQEDFVDPSDPDPSDPDPSDPDPSDPDPGAEKITFETDLSWDTPNAVEDDRDYIVIIKAEEGVANLVVKIESDNNLFLESAGSLMPLEFDLAYPGDYGEALRSIGLRTEDQVIGQTEVPFDITDLVPLLAAFPGTHRFVLTVTDQASNSLSKTLTFVAL